VQRDGRLRQLGGRGFLLGDVGSGAVMGRALLAKAMRAADGFDPMTPLRVTILDVFGGCEGSISFAYTARPADFARLAPRIVNADDPAASAIFDAAVKGLDSDIAVLQQGARMPVVFSGGLGPFYARRLETAWPQRPAKGTPLEGAVAMAIRLAAGSDNLR
ncbi:MAG: ATPase, partial [Paracoccus sp. (in: a-proteobacteria)]|nr:ATPase [Paracoccus sp. (in: a-proteobacteria)]